MPHAGGGGGSGGGGFHSSGSSNAPRYDAYGNRHSSYYVRPGFYYNQCYVSFSRKNRLFNSIKTSLFGLGIIFIFVFIGVFSIIFESKYSIEKLESGAIDKYYEVYNEKNDSFEYNILVNIITYKDKSTYDYISIVGDDINSKVDLMFGNQNTTFGENIYKTIDTSYIDLYDVVANALNNVCKEIENIGIEIYKNNKDSSTVLNESDYNDFGDYEIFLQAEENFYNLTGYHVSIYIGNEEKFYKANIIPFIILGVILSFFMAFLIFSIVRGVKAVKVVNKAEKEGKEKDYYEGEINYDEFMKQYSNKNKTKNTSDDDIWNL